MKPKNQTFSFFSAMFLFYFLSTSLLNWFNGTAFKDFAFYLIVLVLDVLALIWIIKIIYSPHYVRSKDLTVPGIIAAFSIFGFILLFSDSGTTEKLLSNIYLILFLLSMAGLITCYKIFGTVKPKVPIANQIIIDQTDDKIINGQEIRPFKTDELLNEINIAIANTEKDTKEYDELIKAKQLTSSIIDQKIKVPQEVISQINDIIKSYNYLSNLPVKTEKTSQTLKKVTATFPDILTGLTSIYDQGIQSNLEKIEVDAQVLQNLLKASGFDNNDFKVN